MFMRRATAQSCMKPSVGIRGRWLVARGSPPTLAFISQPPRRSITMAAGRRAEARIALLEAAGFDRQAVLKMASSFPQVLSLDVESRIALLEAAGFDRKVVLKMASSHPRVLGYDVESRIALLEACWAWMWRAALPCWGRRASTARPC
ncbi:unnamed protein product [Prorocentrum cordatum]|uniref:Uncharacterized protein n=1 Tax=Prorocentrum cordatum TaxID=2364126 RepID=A0ABN9W686_9DINO|nr:unnamed protein product [Polarella glacialis]